MMESASLTDRIEKCEKILKENAKSQIFAPLADALRAKGDLDEAFRVCRQGLRTHPEYGPGHLVMARINFERKMYDWAEQELNEAVRIDSETRATEQLRIEIMIAKENFTESEIALKRLRATGANPLLLQELTQRIEKQKREQRRRRFEKPASLIPPINRQGTPQDWNEQKTEKITLSQALDRLYDMEGIHFIVCAHRDGTVVDHRGDMELDISEVAAFGVEMCRAPQENNFIAFFGEPLQTEVETDDREIVIMRFKLYDLVLFCEKVVNLGSMRLQLDEIVKNLHDG